MKRLSLLIVPVLLALAGCVYEPGYVRADGYYRGHDRVYYDDGYYAPRYSYSYSDPWCCGPSFGISYSNVHRYGYDHRYYDRRYDGRRWSRDGHRYDGSRRHSFPRRGG